MTHYRVIVESESRSFEMDFDGEPQINLTFDHQGSVYKVTTRAHDEQAERPMLHVRLV